MDWFTTLDGRTRTLAVLALAAVLSLGAAIWSLTAGPAGDEAAFDPVPAFPALGEEAGQAQRLVIRTADETLEFELDAGGQWRIPARGGYPAQLPPYIAAARGLLELELVEPKTANPERHDLVGLTSPEEGGTATFIRLERGDGSALAELLVGNAPAAGLDGTPRHYVRRPGEDQTWLAAGRLDIETELSRWLRQDVIEIDRERIVSIDVDLADAPAYRLVPEGEGRGRHFRPDPLPEGQRVKDRFQTNAIGSVFEAMQILDVRPRSEIDFASANKARYRTDEGLLVDLLWRDVDGEIWTAIDPSLIATDPVPLAPAPEGPSDVFEPPLGEPASAERAVELDRDAIAQATADWAFQIPNFKGDQLSTPLADLIEPLPEPGPAAAPDDALPGAADALPPGFNDGSLFGDEAVPPPLDAEPPAGDTGPGPALPDEIPPSAE